jgi:hypothetical protein
MAAKRAAALLGGLTGLSAGAYTLITVQHISAADKEARDAATLLANERKRVTSAAARSVAASERIRKLELDSEAGQRILEDTEEALQAARKEVGL